MFDKYCRARNSQPSKSQHIFFVIHDVFQLTYPAHYGADFCDLTSP